MSGDHVALLAFDDVLDALAAEGRRLVEVLCDPDARLDADVAACAGWKGRDVVVHLAKVQRFWAWVVSRGHAAEPVSGWPEEVASPAASPAELAALCERSTAELLDALRSAGPGQPAWAWWPQDAASHTAASVARHQLHEAVVHRWDAEDALVGRDGEVSPLPVAPQVAADGIDEALRVTFAAETSLWPADAPAGVLVLRCNDHPAAWTVDCGKAQPEVHLGGASMFNTRVSADASDLQLLLWCRPRSFTYKGEASLFTAFLDWPSRE